MNRDDVISFALRLLNGPLGHGAAGNSLVSIPGPASKNGVWSDSLEGFARPFLLYSFLSAGDERFRQSREAEWFVQGFEATAGDFSWPGLRDVGQARVEAALIALGLDIARTWIWDRLSESAKAAIVEWMSPAVGDGSYPQKNWVWFRLIVETFLQSVGGPFDVGEMRQDLRIIESFYRGHGWYSDGPRRAYDHYSGWAFHVYPSLWSRMECARDLAAPMRDEWLRRLDCYVQGLIYLVGGNGSPLRQGRSLIYRFAAAAPFCAAALEGTTSVPMGDLRHATLSVLGHFASEPIFGADGCLTLGWHGRWESLAQRYSGPGSPYWAGKGLMCLMLPEDHPFWCADEGLLPVEVADQGLVLDEPGWLVCSTRADGIVRVYNSGTDHSCEGEMAGDSPLYARWFYSTHTFPLLDGESWLGPSDSASTLVMRGGSRAHRSGWRRLGVIAAGQASVAGAVCSLKVIEPDEEQKHHGAGFVGDGRVVGRLTTVSIVRGAWEVRVDFVANASEEAESFEVSGWPVPFETENRGAGGDCVRSCVCGGGLESEVIGLFGFRRAGCRKVRDASPVAELVGVPCAATDDAEGLHISVLKLAGQGSASETPQVEIEGEVDLRPVITVHWGAGEVSCLNFWEYVGGGMIFGRLS